MNKPTRKQIVYIIIGIFIIALIVYGFLPGPIPVETATVVSARLEVTIDEEGETYVTRHYTVSSPVSAYLRRVDLDPGDFVEEGNVLAELEPPRSPIMDPRSRAEAEAREEAAEASVEQAETRVNQATAERDRMERLAAAGSATQQQLEQARAEAETALAALNTARAELAAARAAFATAEEERAQLPVDYTVRAPVTGRILAVHQRSARLINAGEPLFEIGNTDSLEVRIEVLSQDAVRITPGMRVMLDQWGGDTELLARVTRVERQGRVVVSALGVEERRVNIIAQLESPPEAWANLGSGYRVLAQIVIWEDDNVLQVPTAALFRTQDGWNVFKVENGRAVRQAVTVGHQTGLAAQILDGLTEGEIVIVHPDAEIEDGVRVDAE